jgi:hypothetical protein
MRTAGLFPVRIRKFLAGILSFLQVVFSFFTIPTLVSPQVVSAAMPSTIGFHGRLQDSSGTNISGNETISFSVYASTTGGVALWTESQLLAVDEGFFSANLGSVMPFPSSLDFNQDLFLSIEVNGDGEMSPRVTLNSVPYAYTAGGVNSFAAEPTGTGGRIYYNSASGTLNYYDDTVAQWKALGSAGTSTFQDVTDEGAVTTNAIEFGGGTSTANFAVLGELSVTTVSSDLTPTSDLAL